MTFSAISEAGILRSRDIQNARDFQRYWNHVDLLCLPKRKNPLYVVGFACSDRALELTLRLRYEVFNVELGEGLAESHATGLDQDIYARQMTHLVLAESATGQIIGAYRLQTVRQAIEGAGLYSEQEFDLSPLAPYFHAAVECGRACIAREHRSPATVLLLWNGIAEFLRLHGHRWLFGCCSLTSTDPDDGWRALKTLRAKNFLHPELFLAPQPDFSCGGAEREHDPALGDPIRLPKLFGAYMRLGSRVISQPAIDRAFGTVDFLILLDGVRDINYSSLDMLG